jgi:hypothetical protein
MTTSANMAMNPKRLLMVVLLAFDVWFCPERVPSNTTRNDKKQVVARCAILPGTKSPFAPFAKGGWGDFGIDFLGTGNAKDGGEWPWVRQAAGSAEALAPLMADLSRWRRVGGIRGSIQK